jgi:predicted membrane protein
MRNSRTTDGTAGIIILALIVFFFVNGPGSRASERRKSSTDADFSDTAFLGGVERQDSSPAFRSGDATAVMGGIKLDLRNATMEGNEATIDVTAVMGGAEIYVPRTWTVVNHVTPILGGVTDHTHPSDGNTKRLIIEGTAVMGGVDIKN